MTILSIIVAVLTTLVTLLIGFQIWNAIDFDNRIKKVEAKLTEKLKEEKKLACNDSVGFCFVQNGVLMFGRHDYSGALILLFNGLINLQNGSCSTSMKRAINDAELHLCKLAEKELENIIGTKDTICIEELQRYIVAAGKVEDEKRKSLLINFMSELIHS